MKSLLNHNVVLNNPSKIYVYYHMYPQKILSMKLETINVFIKLETIKVFIKVEFTILGDN